MSYNLISLNQMCHLPVLCNGQVIVHRNTIVGNNSLRVLWVASAITIVQHFHALLHQLFSLFTVQHNVGIFNVFAEQRQRQVITETRANTITLIRFATYIDMPEERFAILHAANDNIQPERLHLTAAIVEDSGQVREERLWLQFVSISETFVVDAEM